MPPTDILFSTSASVHKEGLNAIEMLDPRMDPGAIPSLPSIEELISSGKLPLGELNANQVLSIMDSILLLEVCRCVLRHTRECTMCKQSL